MTELRNLLEDLRRGGRPPLTVDDVELLLGWLTGSAAREGADGADLPRPGHDAVLLQMVLHRLDHVLFDDGELRPAAAGLDTSEPATRRRIRFRRLASAFHPDRFPELADWLTQRSQAVHRAYARFKQDPEAPVATAHPHVPPHAARARRQDVRRAPPRPRKRHFRALANRLRARFGNDRYLAHKLIGGLALVALLPVLNMVLVPGKESVDGLREKATVDGLRLTVDAGKEQPVGRGSIPDGGNPTEKQADQKASLARQAPTPVEGSEPTAPATTSEPATGVGAGLAGEDRGPDSQSLARQAPTPVGGSEPTAGLESGSEISTGVGAGLAGEDRGPETRITSASAATADSDAPARKASTVKRQPAPQALETVKRQPSSSATEPEITPLLAAARRAMNPNGEVATIAALQTVDEQLAAMGLPSDTERLYRRIGKDETVDGLRLTVDAGKEQPVGRGSIPDGEQRVGRGSTPDGGNPTEKQADRKASLARQAPTPVEGSEPTAPPTTSEPANQPTSEPANQPTSEPATGVGAGLAGDRVQPDQRVGRGGTPDGDNPTEKQADLDDSLARQAPTPVAKSEAAAPPEPTTNNQQPTANQAPSDPAADALVLGPLGRHPAGEVLQRFHAALQAGNIAGVADSFAPDARMDSLRGRKEIADHFRPELNPADSRRVELKVLRLGREDDGWRVEADLDVRVQRDESTRTLVTGRSSFWLAERGDRLMITRMELE